MSAMNLLHVCSFVCIHACMFDGRRSIWCAIRIASVGFAISLLVYGGALQSRLLVMLVCIRAIMFCVSCLFMLSEFRGKQA